MFSSAVFAMMSTTLTGMVLGLFAAPAQAIKATPTPPPLEEVRALVAGRNVAVFFHIAKAGGSSINSLFRKEGAEVVSYLGFRCFAWIFGAFFGADQRVALLQGVPEHAPACEKLRAQLHRKPRTPLAFEIHDGPSVAFFWKWIAPNLPRLRGSFQSAGGRLYATTILRDPAGLLTSRYRMWPPLYRPSLPENTPNPILTAKDAPNHTLSWDVHALPLRTWLEWADRKTFPNRLPGLPYQVRYLSTAKGASLAPMSEQLRTGAVNRSSAEKAAGLRKNTTSLEIINGCASLDAWRAAILTSLTDPCLFDFYCTLDRAPNYAELIGQAIFGRSISANLTRKVPYPDIRYNWLNFKARAVAELNHQSGLARADAATAAVLAKVTACERHFYERAWAHHRACVLPIEQCTAHAHAH